MFFKKLWDSILRFKATLDEDKTHMVYAFIVAYLFILLIDWLFGPIDDIDIQPPHKR